ncbi:hypothetical protein LXL04_014668 [Taraxacum kok-saghyz]
MYTDTLFLSDREVNRITIFVNNDVFKGEEQKPVSNVGCSTGILLIFCAQAGAKRFYAYVNVISPGLYLDASEIALQANEVVKANNLSDKVFVLHGHVEAIQIDEEVDVIVSEWITFLSRNPISKIGGSLGKANSVTKVSHLNCKIQDIDSSVKYCTELRELRLAHSEIGDCCLIPESPFYLEGQGGLFEFIQHRLKENGHVVIVVAEGAGQVYVSNAVNAIEEKDASGNKLLLDIGQWLTQKIKDHFAKVKKVPINMKYIGT